MNRMVPPSTPSSSAGGWCRRRARRPALAAPLRAATRSPPAPSRWTESRTWPLRDHHVLARRAASPAPCSAAGRDTAAGAAKRSPSTRDQRAALDGAEPVARGGVGIADQAVAVGGQARGRVVGDDLGGGDANAACARRVARGEQARTSRRQRHERSATADQRERGEAVRHGKARRQAKARHERPA